MSRLIVEAVQDEAGATSGQVLNASLLVSVTDETGNAVEGLKAANFNVINHGSTPGVELHDATDLGGATGKPSFYYLHVGPAGDFKWKVNVYLLAITVTRTTLGTPTTFQGKEYPSSVTTDRGQTVARISIPE